MNRNLKKNIAGFCGFHHNPLTFSLPPFCTPALCDTHMMCIHTRAHTTSHKVTEITRRTVSSPALTVICSLHWRRWRGERGRFSLFSHQKINYTAKSLRRASHKGIKREAAPDENTHPPFSFFSHSISVAVFLGLFWVALSSPRQGPGFD